MAGLRGKESQFGTLPNQLVKTCWLLLKYDPEGDFMHVFSVCAGGTCTFLHSVLGVFKILSRLALTGLYFVVNRHWKQVG